MSSVEVHRPGIFKQRNKSHKTGRHRSKGNIASEVKGKTEPTVAPKKRKATLEKHDKKNQQTQIKKRKLEETSLLKRSRGVAGSPPFLVVVLPSSQNYNLLDELTNSLGNQSGDVIVSKTDRSTVIVCERFKQRFEFIQPTTSEGYINAAKLADCLMIGVNLELIDEDEAIDEFAVECISSLYHQGLTSVVLSCQGIKSVPIKKQSDTKKSIQKMFEEKFPDLKIHPLDSTQDAIAVLRTVGSQKVLKLNYRECRPNLFASKVELSSSDDGKSELTLSGYLRGDALSANQLIHIPGYGNFQISTISGPNDPCPMISKKQKMDIDHDMESNVLHKSDPDKQESLEMEQEVDPMANEQTWPTEEELAEAAERLSMKKLMKKSVPKGFSDYQAAWLSDDEEDDEDDDEDNDDMDCDDDDEEGDDDDAIDQEDEESSEVPMDAHKGVRFNFEMDTMSVADGDAAYDARFDEDEEKEALQRYKEARMQEMFPDEVDTPDNVDARARFEKYRGLKSFRTSPWDVNEDLPADYEKIIRFKDIKTMKKRVMQQTKDEKQASGKVDAGTYVTITASVDDPSRVEGLVTSPEPVVAFGLLPFEQKLTVMHFVIRRRFGDKDVVKSKDPMIFYVGCHRFKAFPIYSQHTKGPLHKFEKFFAPESSMVATIYAPMIFPPSSVLMFKPTSGGEKLVGTGNLLSADPNRRIIKRIILSGHPFKVNKRSAVIRYMFFNREDVDYYKPIELRTKTGHRGHISGAIGTHGHMKCVFDHQLSSQDVVLMNLYKRVYPKWIDYKLEQS